MFWLLLYLLLCDIIYIGYTFKFADNEDAEKVSNLFFNELASVINGHGVDDLFVQKWINDDFVLCVLDECINGKKEFIDAIKYIDSAFGIRIVSGIEHSENMSFTGKFTVIYEFKTKSRLVGRFSCIVFFNDDKKCKTIVCSCITPDFKDKFLTNLQKSLKLVNGDQSKQDL